MSSSPRSGRLALIGGLLAGAGASACCAGPLLVVSLGFGGAWLSQLTAMEPLRPLLIVLTLACFAVAFQRLYLAPVRCEPDRACAAPAVRVRQRRLFWLALLVTAAIVAFPWYAPLFY
jgi:mercuric ion transport protein